MVRDWVKRNEVTPDQRDEAESEDEARVR
jgi:hypothetical protein